MVSPKSIPSLHFVVTTPEFSLSEYRKNRRLNRQIHRHAQKGLRDRFAAGLGRTPLATKRLEHSTSTLVGWRTPENASPDEDETYINGARQDLASQNRSSLVPLLDTPQRAVDAVANTTFTLNAEMRSILKYFDATGYLTNLKVDAPTTSLFTRDANLPREIVRGALQTDSKLPLYALLASTSRIMIERGASFSRAALPEFYTVEAIRALRTMLWAQSPISSPSTIFAVSLLILAEAFTASPSRVPVYHCLIREAVFQNGGLAHIDPFYARSIVTSDLAMSIATMTLPVLNPYQDWRLLGIDHEAHTSLFDHDQAEVHYTISKLDLRLQVILLSSVKVSQTIEAISMIPGAVAACRAMYRDRNCRIIHFWAATLSHNCIPKTMIDAVATKSPTLKADALCASLKFGGSSLWLYCWALDDFRIKHNRQAPSILGDTTIPQPIQDLISSTSWYWKVISEFYSLMVNDLCWTIPDHVFLWLSAFGVLVSTAVSDRRSHTSWLLSLARKIGIGSQASFKEALARYMPLDCVLRVCGDRTSDVTELLWLSIHDPLRGGWREYEYG
jgi:hypothetical protein